MALVLVPSNVSLEPYDGSRSQKSHNNVGRMLSVVYFHCKTIRNGANITAHFEKSHSKISHFRPQKNRKKSRKILEGLINDQTTQFTGLSLEGGKAEIINPTDTEHDFGSLGLIKLYTVVYIQAYNMASMSIIY